MLACAAASAALEGGFALFQERLDRLAMVVGAAGHGLAPRLAIEQFAELMRDREVEIRFHVGIRDSGAVGDSLGGRVQVIAERRSRRDPVHQANAQRLVGADDIGKEIEFARLGGADQPGQ